MKSAKQSFINPRAVSALTARNVKVFMRDRAAIFFSFLSTLILVALYFLFIARMYTSGLVEGNEYAVSGGAGARNFLVYTQMMAGVLILNSMSLSVGVFNSIARDFESRKTDSYLLTPARSREITASYFIAGFLVSFGLNLFTWIVSYVLIGALTGYWLAAVTFLTVAGILAASSLVSGALMILITALVKSPAAIGVIGGVSGTFLGFLCGIYMPYSNFGNGMKAVGSLLPFTHLTVWMKQAVLGDALSQLNVTGELKDLILGELFSAESVGFCGLDAPLWLMLLFCGVFALVCLILAAWRIKKRTQR